MGRQNKTKEVVSINPKKMGKAKGLDCLEELNAYISCIATAGVSSDERCAGSKKALSTCASAVARRPKVSNTINYHLQRISRLMK